MDFKIPNFDMPDDENIEIDDDEVQDELAQIMQEVGGGKAPKKKTPAKKPAAKGGKGGDLGSMLDAAKALGDEDDNVDIDGIDVDDDELRALGLDPDDDEIKSEKNAKKKAPSPKKTPVAQDIDALDDSDGEPEVKPKQRHRERGEKKIRVKSVGVERVQYEGLFNYFAGCFFNFLNVADDPDVAQTYRERLEEMKDDLFAGDSDKTYEIHKMHLPKPMAPFAHWASVKKKRINTDSNLGQPDVNEKLKASGVKLLSLKKMATEAGDQFTLQNLEHALLLVKKTPHNLPNPPFLVPTYVTVNESNGCPRIAANEYVVLVRSVKGFTGKFPAKLNLQIGASTKIVLQINQASQDLNKSFNVTGFDARSALRQWQKPDVGKVWFDNDRAKAASFGLATLLTNSIADLQVHVEGATVSFQVAIRQPLEGLRQERKLVEYWVSPLVVTEEQAYTPPPASPKSPAAPAKSPAKGTPAKAPAKAPAEPAAKPVPKPYILSPAERAQFWPYSVMAHFRNQEILVADMEKAGVSADALKDQVAFFKKAVQDFEDKSEEIDREKYFEDVKKSLTRMQGELKSAQTEELRQHLRLCILHTSQEIAEIEEGMKEEE